jgi:predicted secreted protein
MSLTLGCALYFIIWWTALFAVLPFFARSQADAGDVVPGTPESAPAVFQPLRIVSATTVVASLVFAALWAAFHWRLIDVDAMLSRGLGG